MGSAPPPAGPAVPWGRHATKAPSSHLGIHLEKALQAHPRRRDPADEEQGSGKAGGGVEGGPQLRWSRLS